MIKLKEASKEILSKLIGFIIFLVLLGIANTLMFYIHNDIFISSVNFLNANIWLIIIFSIIFFIGDLFNYLPFPLNVPAPIFNAVGGTLIIQFAFRLLNYVIKSSKIVISLPFNDIEKFIITIVFILVIIIGYIDIINHITKYKKRITSKKEHIINNKVKK